MRNRIFWQFSITIPLALAGVTAASSGNHVLAQLDPDNSLGAENSIVTPQQLRDLIQGGAIRGNALFHSFDEFNVGSDRGVFFDLQNNTDILNIFTRVTGGNVSNILGTLGVLQDALNSNVLGNANLFLLNPNGITFGANASLQLNGSFFATTADGFGFDNFTFSASGQEAPPPLLTISIPRFASFRDNPGDIAVNQSNLTVNQGQSLSLVGGNVTVTGSGDITNLQGTVNAPGGRIELGGLTVAETVNINPDLSLVFPDGVVRSDVSLANAATLSVVSNAADLNGGSVALTGQNLSITRDSAILGGIGAGFGGDGVTAGDIDLNATGEITISDSTSGFLISGELTQGRGVQNRLNQGATGTGGNVKITANSLSITNGGFISISTLGFGDAGDINVNVAGAVTIDGLLLDDNGNPISNSRISNVVADTAVGDSGDIIINAGSLSLTNGGVINTQVFGSLFDAAGELTPGGRGDGGDIIINVADSVTVAGTDVFNDQGLFLGTLLGQIVSNVGTGAVGNSGDISISANSLSMPESGQIQTSILQAISTNNTTGEPITIPAGQGNAGSIQLNIAESISLAEGSQIRSDTFGIGNAGSVTINGRDGQLPNLSIDGADVINNVIVSSGIFTFVGSQQQSPASPESIGQGFGGHVTINAQSLAISNGAQINASTAGIGDAGDISINTTEAITLDGFNIVSNSQGEAVLLSGIFSSVNSGAIGDAGDITIQADSLSLSNVSFLQSRVFSEDTNNGLAAGNGNAGDIDIDVRTLSLTGGSEILSDTFGQGEAGKIIVNASESVILSGVAPFPSIGSTVQGGFSSGLIASTEPGASDNGGGAITVTTGDLVISDGAVISARSRSESGDSGVITINANTLELTRGGQILNSTFQGGSGNDININVTESITISGNDPTFDERRSQAIAFGTENLGLDNLGAGTVIDPTNEQSGIFATTAEGSTGTSGSIIIDPELITIEDGGTMSVNSQGSGLGGTIDITADVLLLRNGNGTPLISANSESDDGGNITINTTALVALPGENSDITANSIGGLGGRVTINADGVFGIQASEEENPENNDTNDITASSSLGPQFSGQVIFNTPETNPGQENIEPPEEVTDSTDIVAQNACSIGTGSQLANTGRGGVPQIPGFIIRNDTVDVDLVDEVLPAPPPEAIKPHHRTNVTFLDSEGEEFKPAMGAVLLPNGMVQFVDYNPTEVYRDMYAAAGCSH